MANLVKMIRKADGKHADVHPDMVKDYVAGGFEPESADPFDHDGDGKPGGSLPKPKKRKARK